ncbi:MAG: glycoside hydrolase [Marinagarivorans sp.]|nr:glycoside hydrolase [Marinagarivorans sp.]
MAHEPVACVDKCYLSFSIDISVLAGGQWWEGSNTIKAGLGALKVAPLALNSPKLDGLTRTLLPAYLRVGGSEADKIHYLLAPDREANSVLLTHTMWDELHAFVARNDLRLAFTFKYGLFKRSDHGAWRDTEVDALLAYSQQKGYRVDVCELGNELNAYWAFHGLASQPRAANLAIDYATFAAAIRRVFPAAKIIGPGSAFWPRLGETIRPFSNITPKFLAASRTLGNPMDVVDWHYYPFQSRRSPIRTRRATVSNMLRPSALNEYKKYCLQLKCLRDRYFPAAELWTGESGSAQCGGEPKLSDRFASCFWWADQLGLGARYGQQVMVRQSLVGGDYGLLDRLTLKPRPDYWLSWLWKQLMGTQVYAVDAQHAQLRCYCHSTKLGDGRVVLLINLSAKPCEVAMLGEYWSSWRVTKRYVLTAKKLSAKKIKINGKKARLKNGLPPDLSRFEQVVPAAKQALLPPHSLAFWQLEAEPNA